MIPDLASVGFLGKEVYVAYLPWANLEPGLEHYTVGFT